MYDLYLLFNDNFFYVSVILCFIFIFFLLDFYFWIVLTFWYIVYLIISLILFSILWWHKELCDSIKWKYYDKTNECYYEWKFLKTIESNKIKKEKDKQFFINN